MQRSPDKTDPEEQAASTGLLISSDNAVQGGLSDPEGQDRDGSGETGQEQPGAVPPGPMPMPTTMRPVPVSLRLQPAPDAGPALRAAPVIGQFARNAGTTRRVETTYYDTPEGHLFRAGISLRVQKAGRRCVQILSPRAGHRIGPDYPAWELPLREASPDLRDLARVQVEWLPPAARELLERGPLVPVFVARLRRLTRRLDLPDAVVDVTFEDGAIEAQAAGTQVRREEVDRIILVLRGGDSSALHEVGLRLLDAAPLQVGAGSLLQRGHALATGTALRAEKAARSSLTTAVSTDEAIAGVLDACRLHLQANQAVAQEGRSAEGVHQMRVALRRLRSILSLLRRDLPSAAMQGLGREARWAADQLGAARGWDVFLADSLSEPLQQRVQPGDRVRQGRVGPDFQALRKAVEAPRANAYRSVRALLASPRFSRFQLTLGHWIARRGWRNEVGAEGLALLSEQAALPAAAMLTRLHRKALKQGRQFRRLSADGRHELRITLKKLRYATEFFLPVFAAPDHAHRFVRRLSRLQEALGLDHDAAETQPLLDELGRRNRAPGLHQAIGVVIGWQAREEVLNVETLAVQWRRFRTMQPFWPRLPRLRAEPGQPEAVRG